MIYPTSLTVDAQYLDEALQKARMQLDQAADGKQVAYKLMLHDTEILSCSNKRFKFTFQVYRIGFQYE